MTGMLVANVYDDVIIVTPWRNNNCKTMTIDDAIVYSKENKIPFLYYGLKGKLRRKIKRNAFTIKPPIKKIGYLVAMAIPPNGGIMDIYKKYFILKKLKEGNELVVEKGYYLMTIGEAEVFQKFFKNYEFN